MLLETLRVCGDNSCNRGPAVTQMYVEVGAVDVAAVRVVVFEEM
jgi:hypothetical protein